MSDLSTLKLFATHPHPCSYLKGEEATTVFIDPDAKIDQSLYSQLSQLGFRRSGAHLYRPQCSHIIEVVNTVHYGINKGSEPAEILVFYAGEEGKEIVVKETIQK